MKNRDVRNTITQHNVITPHRSLFTAGDPYPCRFIHRNSLSTGGKKNEYVYSFINRIGYKYYIYCIEYNIGVFAVKFCLKTDRNNPNRYKIVTNFGDGIKVLKTVVSAMLDILKRNEDASFAFIGMPRHQERTNHTTRYKIYSQIARRYFSPSSFDHLYDDQTSFYAILNKKSNISNSQQRELTRIAAEELKSEQEDSQPIPLGGSVY